MCAQMIYWRRLVRVACRGLAFMLTVVAAEPVHAHPHVFVDARLEIVFTGEGKVREVRHVWTFDEMFAIWQTQGLDKDGDGEKSTAELQKMLAGYRYFTLAGERARDLPLASMDDAKFSMEGGRAVLRFGLEPQEPYRILDTLNISVRDPEYYTAISLTDVEDIVLVDAPDGCTVSLLPRQPLPENVRERLRRLSPDIRTLPADIAAAVRDSQGGVAVSCPAATDRQTEDAQSPAPDRVAQASSPTPFGGPPAEPGLMLPTTGFFGWLAEMQKEFYGAINGALNDLKRGQNAFWVLGSLSFLYGVLHAAGPGHGKVVIASYVVANERQVRRGVQLSFVSAMLQSAVAIGFVLVAAALLNLTATAMNNAASWIGIASYALIALLGLYLIGRKLFGWGHRHAHRRDAHIHDHDHLEHGHHGHHGHTHGDRRPDPIDHHHHEHFVPPQRATGTWQEQLGVILAVGLRPCSGALIVLAFAFSQGLLLAGIGAVVLMGLGTALTVAVIASLALGFKGALNRLDNPSGGTAAWIVSGAELLGAVMVFLFGVLFLVASLSGVP
jgi:ABC-type nickel/cobalt efflux system permease component RcnA/ABC-type uncharacterized transport system substrate-binding protein